MMVGMQMSILITKLERKAKMDEPTKKKFKIFNDLNALISLNKA